MCNGNPANNTKKKDVYSCVAKLQTIYKTNGFIRDVEFFNVNEIIEEIQNKKIKELREIIKLMERDRELDYEDNLKLFDKLINSYCIESKTIKQIKKDEIYKTKIKNKVNEVKLKKLAYVKSMNKLLKKIGYLKKDFKYTEEVYDLVDCIDILFPEESIIIPIREYDELLKIKYYKEKGR